MSKPLESANQNNSADVLQDVVPPPAAAPEAPGNLHINRVAVRAPPFWKENPALWFVQLESQFHTNGITASETKYHVAVAALDTSVINQVSDVVMRPPAANLMYETLKRRLQERFAESEECRFRKLLSNLELGDKKPSHLWREMRELAADRVEDAFLRSLWLQRLPAQIQAILSTDDGDVARLLTMADRICEVLDVQGAVRSMSSSTSSRSSVSAVPVPANPEELSNSSELKRLCNQVNELSQQLAAFSVNNNNNYRRSRSSDRGGRMRSRSRSVKQHDECWYHFRFGEDAKKCIKPCTYKPEN